VEWIEMEEFLWFLDHQTPQESGTCFEGNIERDFIARAKDFSKISRPIRIALRCPKRRNDGLSHQRVRDLQVSKQRAGRDSSSALRFSALARGLLHAQIWQRLAHS